MRHYRSRARIDVDRFGYVRDRERFLYEPETYWPESYEETQPARPWIAAICLSLLLTAALALGALYLLKQPTGHFFDIATVEPKEPQQQRTIAVVTTQEPELRAALPPIVEASNNCSRRSCDEDRDIARVAWQYFERNYQQDTGLVNSVDQVEITTLWDVGSSIAAFIAARDFELITQRDFDHAIMALLQTLAGIELVNRVAPNILYNTRSARMVDYDNVTTDGLGVSTIDLARSAFWLNTLQCMHPKYFNPVKRVLGRWDYEELFIDGELYGLARDEQNGNSALPIQQGRFGFEQYAGRVFRALGHDTQVSASYDNRYRANTEILGTMIAHDSRDPRNTGVNNFVLTDSYTLDAIEHGIHADNADLLRNIYEVQKQRWRQTGIATALTDGHINQPPHYLFDTIFDAGLPFTTTTDTGVRYDELRTISTRAAFMLAALFPDDRYSEVLLSAVESAYDPELGWFSGVYENGGFNDITTANTNGIILESMLYKKYGVLNTQCKTHWAPNIASTENPSGAE